MSSREALIAMRFQNCRRISAGPPFDDESPIEREDQVEGKPHRDDVSYTIRPVPKECDNRQSQHQQRMKKEEFWSSFSLYDRIKANRREQQENAIQRGRNEAPMVEGLPDQRDDLISRESTLIGQSIE